MSDKHSRHSTLRERIVEHRFVADVLQYLWTRDIFDVEVLRPEFDAHGYDLVMTRGNVVRHIQLKTGRARGKPKKPSRISVSRSLAEKPSGCLLWIGIDDNLKPEHFFWLGSACPGEPISGIDSWPAPKRRAPRTDGDRPDRDGYHVIPKDRFELLNDVGDVLQRLFGNLSP